MEDVVMRRELLRFGGAIKSPLVIKTSSARFDRLGPLRTQSGKRGIFPEILVRRISEKTL